MPAVALSRVGTRVVESGPRRPGPGCRCVAAAERAAGPALAARTDLPAGLPDRGRRVRVHRGRERPVHRRSGSGSGGPARQTWPGCAPRGTRSPAGTGRRMRRRSGSCWTASARESWPGPCSGHAPAGAPAGRPRPPCAVTVPGQAQALARGRLRAVAADSPALQIRGLSPRYDVSGTVY